MIDFIRIHYKDKSIIEPFICKEENFSQLITSLEYHSSEIQYPYKTRLKNIEVIVNEKSAYVKNSLHKLYNLLQARGNQNHNDFTYSNLCDVIDYLCDHIIDLDKADITQLEFGLNIPTTIPAEIIIRDNVLMHKYAGYNHKGTSKNSPVLNSLQK